MKKIFVLFVLLASSIIYSQSEVNLNPDSDGDPWYLDNYKMPEIMNIIPDEFIEAKNNERTLKGKDLPASLNHLASEYLRPIFVQSGGSCGSASQICYMFAYEINNHRNVDASLPENIYPSHFTFMTADEHANQAQMAAFNGIPNSIMWGGETYSTIFGREVGSRSDCPDCGWMTGYGRWKNAMKNKIKYNDFIFITSPEKLEFLKGWIYDHNGEEGFNEGGLAGTGIAISNADIVQIPLGFNGGGKYILKEWGPHFDHAMTWVGWDDSIGYDYNGDGVLTNDIDINGDGRVDMLDWEKGSMILLNSWGDTWANGGWVYIPYRVLREHKMIAEFYHIRKNYSPKMIFKVKMTYSQRNRIKLLIGISSSPEATRPEKSRICPHFVYQGQAEVPLLGRWADNVIHDEPMEFELDLTDLLYGFDIRHPFTVFLKTVTTRTGGEGELDRLSLIDYIGNPNGTEYVAEIPNPTIQDGKILYFPISLPGNPQAEAPEYVYIPQSELSVYYVDSEESNSGKAIYSIDGKINTFWHTSYGNGVSPLPHTIIYELNEETAIDGIEYIGRQDGGAGANGRIGSFELYLSSDAQNWGEPVLSDNFNNSSMPQRKFFPTQNGKYVKLVALSEASGNDYTTVAEFNLLKKFEPNGVDDNNNPPFKYSLSQNYPNPFNPTTTISYVIARSPASAGTRLRLGRTTGNSANAKNTADCHAPLRFARNDGIVEVSLKVFDILGREVATLVNAKQKPGKYSVQFNAISVSGGLPSGVYFYTLRAGNFVQSRKMILLK